MSFSFPNNDANNPANKTGLPGLPTPPKLGGLPTPPSAVPKNVPQQGVSLPNLPKLPSAVPPARPATSAPSRQEQQYKGSPEHEQNFDTEEEEVSSYQSPKQRQQENFAAKKPDTNAFDEDEESAEEASKPRRTKRAKPAPRKNTKVSRSAKKPNQFSGKRKNVLLARIVVFSIVGMLVLAGISSFLPKASGLTASDGSLIISKVRENLNVTDFPKTQGEGVSLGFTEAYLNYDPALKAERYELLQTYVSENILAKIDARPATEEEIAAALSTTPVVIDENGETVEAEDAPIDTEAIDTEATDEETGQAVEIKTQTITDGPYLVGSEMFKGGNAALFTTMTQVNGNNWLFLEIPVYYDEVTGTMSVSGSPTFAKPINIADVPEAENSSTWTIDREIVTATESKIVNYMQAWAASEPVGIENRLVKENGKVVASPDAAAGLGGSVKFVNMSSYIVEQKEKPEEGATAEAIKDYQTRDAEVSITVLEPTSNMVYTQNYRLVLRYVNEDWFVEDIQNVSALLDRDEIIAKKATAASNEN